MSRRKAKYNTDPFKKTESSKYRQPIISREQIIAFLREQKKQLSFRKLFSGLGLEEKHHHAFEKRLAAMVRDGQVTKTDKGYLLGKVLESVSGLFYAAKDGSGVVVGPDARYQLSAYQARTLMHKDKVLVRPVEDGGVAGSAVLMDVLERHMQQIIGVCEVWQDVVVLKPLSSQLTANLMVETLQVPVSDKDIVLADILEYAKPGQPTTVSISKVLGNQSTTGIETTAAIHMHQINTKFSQDVQDEVANISDEITLEDGRKDWRNLQFVTIDGASSKDFDDAVYAEALPNDEFALYIAIADVAHYVKPGTALDEEAFERATSVYFSDRVVPMLPFKLSNDLCSLNPHQDRYALGVRIHVGVTGQILSSEVGRVLMQSHARLTYDKVQSMVDGIQQVPAWFSDSFNALLELTHVLLAARAARGAIEFAQDEPHFKLDARKKIESVKMRPRLFTHRLIEECMLLCNEAMAKALLNQRKTGVFRNHDAPDPEKQEVLIAQFRELGLDLSQGLDHVIRNLLDTVDEHQKNIVQTALIRSLKQAKYQESCSGHYGLALENYTHFTSPIRRYPDLLVHRLIMNEDVPIDQLARMTLHCSERERLAEDCSRDALAWLKADFMARHLGQSFSGVISGVMPFGVFVQITSLSIDGLLHVTQLPDGYYDYDENRQVLYCQSTQQMFKVGDALNVSCNNVDIWNRKIDFILS